jgi:outer membrane protein assembly factor BamB
MRRIEGVVLPVAAVSNTVLWIKSKEISDINFHDRIGDTEMNEEKSNPMLNILRSVSIVSGLFAVVLCILVLANYFQNRAVAPLNSPALKTLMERLETNPGDEELKEQIRALDLRARKAYFTSQWQERVGGYLIFCSVLLCIVAQKLLARMRPISPTVKDSAEIEDTWLSRAFARKWLVWGGGILVVLSITVVIFSGGKYDNMFSSAVEADSETNTVDGNAQLGPEGWIEQWPAFRGPGGIGVAEFRDVPIEWDGASGQNILWKTEISLPGFNSPIRWNDRLFLSGADADAADVYCIDVNSGKIIWQYSVTDIPGSPEEKPDVSEDTGYAASTMTTNGKAVFALYANGDLVALDLDGQLLWSKNLGMPDNHYGHSSSLIMVQDRLIIQYDQGTGGQVFALESQTGEQIWSTTRAVEMAWTSPAVVFAHNRPQIVLSANPIVAAYEPESGKEIWAVECMSGEVAPSPAFAAGVVYAVNEYAVLVAIDPSTEARIIWENDEHLSEVASPVSTKDYVFMPTSFGDFYCIDAKQGTLVWSQEFDEGFYASPVIIGNRVYALDMSGVMHIFDVADSYQTIGDPELGESTMSTPAFDHGRIYIRGEKHLFAIGSS